MIVTNEYVYNNRELKEINDVLEKTRVEHARKHGYNCEEIKINFNVYFFDKKITKEKILRPKV